MTKYYSSLKMKNKTEQRRVNFQCTVDFKQKFKYITSMLRKVINRTSELKKDNAILLSQCDLEFFLSTVEPNKALTEAAAEYRVSSLS